MMLTYECEDIAMDEMREAIAFRNEVYANLNNAYNNDELYFDSSAKIRWKQASSMQVARDMLDKTDIGQRYGCATVQGVAAHVRRWIDTLP